MTETSKQKARSAAERVADHRARQKDMLILAKHGYEEIAEHFSVEALSVTKDILKLEARMKMLNARMINELRLQPDTPEKFKAFADLHKKRRHNFPSI